MWSQGRGETKPQKREAELSNYSQSRFKSANMGVEEWESMAEGLSNPKPCCSGQMGCGGQAGSWKEEKFGSYKVGTFPLVEHTSVF